MLVQELVLVLVQFQVLTQVFCRGTTILNTGQGAGAISNPGTGPGPFLIQVLLQVQVRIRERSGVRTNPAADTEPGVDPEWE